MFKLDAILFTLAFYLVLITGIIAILGIPPTIETELRHLLRPVLQILNF